MISCDGCGKDRKPYLTITAPDDVLRFCFLCVKEGERDELRRQRAEFASGK